ncbi:MAG: hypothetical protein HY815_06485, partial [Candidatus Riflebacteria bacterium]|nr:hypothetical protein [Candidatus Riflebacteria bacterium]
AAIPWSRMGEAGWSYGGELVSLIDEQIQRARELETDSFAVFGIKHKFGSKLEHANCFGACHAVLMTMVLMPPGENGSVDAFTVGLCCDRRADDRLPCLVRDGTDLDQIRQLWGSPEHWMIRDSIRVATECPRCTYQPHNQIFEHVILEDNMTLSFI